MSYTDQQLPPDNRPLTRPRPPAADADGAAIASLITAFFIPPLGIIFGCVSAGQAHRRGLRQSGVASWGITLGAAFTILVITGIIMIVVSASHGVSYQDCVNNAILYNTPVSACTP